MLFLWFIQRAKQDAGVVDFGWCASIGLLALYFAVASHGWPLRRGLVAALAVLWAGRLAAYLLVDRILGRPEDFRYRIVRERLGPRANGYFLLYFVGHSFLVLPFCIPLLIVMAHPRPELGIWEIVGLFLGGGAILGESIADQHLARFRARPGNRGRTCRQGLWRYSRHPNYFFEWLYWCSYPIIAVGAPRAWLALVGSFGILIPLFLLTGIPATEARAVANRGEDYRAYQRSTSAFIPWFPGRE